MTDTTTKPDHTPLPWIANPCGLRAGGKTFLRWIFATDSPAQANIDFIERACNSHYDLLEALRGMLLIGDVNLDAGYKLAGRFPQRFEAARAAVAKTQGE